MIDQTVRIAIHFLDVITAIPRYIIEHNSLTLSQAVVLFLILAVVLLIMSAKKA